MLQPTTEERLRAASDAIEDERFQEAIAHTLIVLAETLQETRFDIQQLRETLEPR